MKRQQTTLILYSLIFLFLAARATLAVGFFNVLKDNVSGLLSSYLLAYMGMIVVYFYMLYSRVRHGEIPERWIRLTFIAISLCAVFIPPSSSCDLYYYTSFSVIQGKWGLNPYLHSISEINQRLSPSFAQVNGFPLFTPMTYGYIVSLALKIIYYLCFGNEIAIYIMVKLISAGTLYLIYVYLGKIMEHFHVEGRNLLGWLFLLNPLVIIQYIVNGHNDGIMVLFICMALYHLFRKKFILAFIMFSLSVHVKLTAILVIPVAVVYCLKKKAGFVRILFYGLLFLLSFAPYIILHGLTKVPFGIRAYRLSYDVSFYMCLHYILSLLANIQPKQTLEIFQFSVFIWIVVYGAGLIRYYREKNGNEIRMCRYIEVFFLIYLAFFSNVIYPWYFLWFIPFILVKNFKSRFVLYTVLFMILEMFFAFIYPVLYIHENWHLPSVLVLYLLLTGIYLVYHRAHPDSGKRIS
jgi:alpha-1,6-mannosyltransferase